MAVQAIGPVCGFLTVLAIARLGGASAQGEFAQVKAWVELLVVVGCFGFPQSFVYVINRLGASARSLAWLSMGYSLAFVPVAVAITLLVLALGLVQLDARMPVLVLLSLTAGLFVLHGLWRGVFLTTGREMGFAVFSILPPVTLLACVGAAFLAGHRGWGEVFVLSAALSALGALTLLWPVLSRPRVPTAPLPWNALVANGTHSFVQALLLVAQPLLAYALIRGQGGDEAHIGWFNAGVFLVQGLSVPISMVSPLLFAHWTSTDDASRMARLNAATPRWLGGGMLLGLLLAALAWVGVPLLFGAGYEAASPLAAVMMLSLPLTCHGRLIAPALHAHDHPMANSVAGVLRLVSLWGLSQGLIACGVGPLPAVSLGWALSETLGSGWVLLRLHQLVQQQAPAAEAAR
jgi:O-antigen/teichoic acid export membrane protein